MTTMRMTPQQIKGLRTQLRLTQLEMSRLLVVRLGTYQSWEFGYRSPSAAAVELLRRVARERGVYV